MVPPGAHRDDAVNIQVEAQMSPEEMAKLVNAVNAAATYDLQGLVKIPEPTMAQTMDRIGQMFGLPRAQGESDDEYRGRLTIALSKP